MHHASVEKRNNEIIVTLANEVVEMLGIRKGDKYEVERTDDGFRLVPVANTEDEKHAE